MKIDGAKLEKLIMLMERWLNDGRNRNAGKLASLTGVNVQTIRRIFQRENNPELGTALSILNVVGSPEEMQEIIGENPIVSDFLKKMMSVQGEKKIGSDEVALQLFNRERFWNYVISMVSGVTRDDIESLCGAYGLYELDRMVQENILYEKIPGKYYPCIGQDGLVVENKDVYSKGVCYISELALLRDNAQKLMMLFNVSEEAFREIKEKFCKTYTECIEIAKNSPGDIVIATSVVNAAVLGEKA